MKVAGRRKDGRTRGRTEGGIIGRGRRSRTHHLHRERRRRTLPPPSVRPPARPSVRLWSWRRAGEGGSNERDDRARCRSSLHLVRTLVQDSADQYASTLHQLHYLFYVIVQSIRHFLVFLETDLRSVSLSLISNLKSPMQHVALRARGRSVGRVPTISFLASFAAPEAGSETALAISRLSWSLLLSLSLSSLLASFFGSSFLPFLGRHSLSPLLSFLPSLAHSHFYLINRKESETKLPSPLSLPIFVHVPLFYLAMK